MIGESENETGASSRSLSTKFVIEIEVEVEETERIEHWILAEVSELRGWQLTELPTIESMLTALEGQYLGTDRNAVVPKGIFILGVMEIIILEDASVSVGEDVI